MNRPVNFANFRSPGVIALIVAIVGAGSYTITWGLQPHTDDARLASNLPKAPLTENLPVDAEESEEVGSYHKPLRMSVDFPGIVNPELLTVNQVDLPDSTEVIGVEIEGQTCAFVLSEMSERDQHVVNVMLEDSPISVSYCNLSECTRVVTSDSTSIIPLRVGGLDIESRMVLLLDGERYSHDSKQLPLADVPFNRLELGTWKRQHPESQIYAGRTKHPAKS